MMGIYSTESIRGWGGKNKDFFPKNSGKKKGILAKNAFIGDILPIFGGLGINFTSRGGISFLVRIYTHAVTW